TNTLCSGQKVHEWKAQNSSSSKAFVKSTYSLPALPPKKPPKIGVPDSDQSMSPTSTGRSRGHRFRGCGSTSHTAVPNGPCQPSLYRNPKRPYRPEPRYQRSAWR
ncbi:MAG: hypothetical protein K2H92_00260, partial [Bacteroidaceae bacterium]|nr:hypothetical protein [Bacteroidaceae bacterium]